MRVPPFKRFRPFSQLASIFVLGMVIGSVMYNGIFHASYNNLWLKYQDLRIQIEQYEEDIKTLKKYNKQQTVIKEIRARAEQQDPPLDSIVVKEILLKLSNDLDVLRGRSVFEIDTDNKITRSLLNGKIYTVRDKEYEIQIKTMLILEGVLQVWVEITVSVRS
ncbi:hypothetical protein [Paenibacillus sp. DS2015]|uniref:hypothetical protein n=1 Tax=Paenibacillus sp. DS2015 TaxID=3373917 RepID=UPI003D1E49CB